MLKSQKKDLITAPSVFTPRRKPVHREVLQIREVQPVTTQQPADVFATTTTLTVPQIHIITREAHVRSFIGPHLKTVSCFRMLLTSCQRS